jgi:hypothetical protein
MVRMRVEFKDPLDRVTYERMMRKSAWLGFVGVVDIAVLVWSALVMGFFALTTYVALGVLGLTFLLGGRQAHKAEEFLAIVDCHIIEDEKK